ncbi:MAG: hypothetical protein H6985_14435 [Pseudomonadales bacterium]|nr:hypothetical protein [Pseudomonadales bacterium]
MAADRETGIIPRPSLLMLSGPVLEVTDDTVTKCIVELQALSVLALAIPGLSRRY